MANAITHRSYLDDSCVQVCIFDDRVEVLSPGMLYGGLDLETAKQNCEIIIERCTRTRKV